MYKIFADYERIFLDSWNQAYGNKILHIFFLINLCEQKQRIPIMYHGSNLDSLFDFKLETVDPESPRPRDYYFVEPDPFVITNGFVDKIRSIFNANHALEEVVKSAHQAFIIENDFLKKALLPNRDIMIKGHFFEYDLMPSLAALNKYLVIKSSVVRSIEQKYHNTFNNNSVAVHYRGTDFNTHLRSIFRSGIALDRNYYLKSMEIVEKALGKVLYHLFSDDLDFLVDIFKDKDYIIHDDDAVHDWASIFLMRNVIQSNSSYCWTASLFNKKISVQPRNGYNYHSKSGSIPCTFAHKNAYLV